MRAEWDFLLSELVGGSDDPDAGALANRIEAIVYKIERERDALRAILEYWSDRLPPVLTSDDSMKCKVEISAGEVRRIRAALKSPDGEGEDGR